MTIAGPILDHTWFLHCFHMSASTKPSPCHFNFIQLPYLAQIKKKKSLNTDVLWKIFIDFSHQAIFKTVNFICQTISSSPFSSPLLHLSPLTSTPPRQQCICKNVQTNRKFLYKTLVHKRFLNIVWREDLSGTEIMVFISHNIQTRLSVLAQSRLANTDPASCCSSWNSVRFCTCKTHTTFEHPCYVSVHEPVVLCTQLSSRITNTVLASRCSSWNSVRFCTCKLVKHLTKNNFWTSMLCFSTWTRCTLHTCLCHVSVH